MKLNSRNIFLLDGIGALVSATLTGLVLPHWSELLGLPIEVLGILALLALVCAVYSLSCYRFAREIRSWMLSAIMIANLIYCLISSLLILFFEEITFAGQVVLAVEILVVLIVVAAEWKTSRSQKTRKRKTVDPCPICALHRERCICAQIPKLDLKTKLTLVIHAKELKRTTNSGRLALHALKNSEMIVRGGTQDKVDLSSLLTDDFETYVLFPSDDAIDIESIKPLKPVQLIVADGNWRQASKMNQRHPELAHLKRVKISQKNLATHHLRKEHFDSGFSTLEAIAIAFGVLEGDAVGKALMDLYQAKLAATLAGRPPPQKFP